MATARRHRTPAFGVGRILARTFAIWFRNLLPFAILTLIVYSPRVLATIASRPTTRRYVATFLLDPLFLMVVTAALVYGVFERLREREAGVGACLRVWLSRLLPVVGVAILVYLNAAIAALPGLLFAGILRSSPLLFLSAIAALAIAARYWVAVPVAVVERKGVFASLRRSVELTQGSKGVIFAVLVLFCSLWYVALIALAREARTLSGYETGSLIIGMVCGTLLAVASAVAYHDIRVSREGVATEDLVRVFA